MPGVFGFAKSIHYHADNKDALLQQMLLSLRHLEIYRSHQHAYNNVGLGKIGLISTFKDSIYVDSETQIAICLSGDIFDYIDVDDDININGHKRTEEIVLQIYRRYDIRTPQKLNGDFNISIYDPLKDRLMICNDRFGFRHLYYYKDSFIFMFAPEIKAFMAYLGFDKTLDEHGVSDYFNYCYHLGNRTMFRNVCLLPPASCLTVKENAIELHTYWEPRYKNERGVRDLSESIDTGYQLFVKSIARRLNGKNDVLIPLSGGLDSRLILSVARQFNCKITTATFGFKDCLDYKIAKRVCTVLDLDVPRLVTIEPHWIYEFAPDLIKFNECNYSSLGLTLQHGFAQTIGTTYDCFLNGIFGGHLAFGSPYFNEIDLHSNYNKKERTNRIVRGLNGLLLDKFLKKCASQKLAEIADGYREKTINEEWDRTEKKSDLYAFRQDSLFLYNRIRRGMNVIDQNRYFYNDQLPFASYELYDFYLTLSPELLLKHYLYKEIYKTKLPDLAKVPWHSSGVSLYQTPSRILKFKKDIKRYLTWYLPRLSKGLVNYMDKDNYEHSSVNYRKNRKIQNWAESILLGDQCLERGWFRRDGLRELLISTRQGRGNFHEISKAIIFELWARDFLD